MGTVSTPSSKMLSKPAIRYIFDRLVNRHTSWTVAHDPADLAFFTTNILNVTGPELLNAWAHNIAHEVGHSLGLLHTQVGSLEVNLNGVAGGADIMAQGIDFNGEKLFTQITSGMLKMALNIGYSEQDVDSALAYVLQNVSKGPFNLAPAQTAAAADGDIPIMQAISTPTGLLLDQNGGILGPFLDLGTVLADGARGEHLGRELRLLNVGQQTLQISRVMLDGASGALRFSGLEAGDFVSSGESRTLTIDYDPLSVEDRIANVRIESNDPTGPLKFSISAHSVSPSSYALLSVVRNNAGGVSVGSTRVELDGYTVTNRGQSQLVLNGLAQIEGSGAFSVVGLPSDLSSNPVALAPGESLSIGYRFKPSTQGLERGIFELTTNDTSHPVLRLTLSGTGLKDGVVVDRGNDYIVLNETSANGSVLRTVSDRGGNFDLVGPANSAYTFSIFDPVSGLIAKRFGTTPASGQTLEATKNLVFAVSTVSDTDGDGLPDDVEFTIGTALNHVDTDRDGIDDFREIKLGLTPLGGRPAVTGVTAGAILTGEAKSIVIEGSISARDQQTAYVATGSYGLAVVDATRFDAPIVLGQIDLLGDSVDVSVDSSLGIAAVASGAGGLNMVNVLASNRPTLLQALAFNATEVEVFEGIAYASSGSELRAYDLLTGEKLASFVGGATITGLAREGRTLFTIDTSRTLRAIDITSGTFVSSGTLLLPVVSNDLFVGGGVAYAGTVGGVNQGFMTVNISNPAGLTLISGVDAPNIIGQALVANGSGILITAGNITTLTGPVNAVDVINVSDPSNTGNFITRFTLPQVPFDLAIGAGIAFVADGTGDLQVVNYLSFDNQGVAPTVTATLDAVDLDPLTPGIQVLEGSQVSVRPTVTDDVQVRNVEVLRGGQVVQNDVAFPFEMSAVLPTIAANGSNLVTLQVRATDTGGNFGLSTPITVQLVPDTFGPTLVSSNVNEGGIVGRSFRAVTLTFSEAIDPATFTPTAVQLVDSNGIAKSADNIQFRANGKQVQLTFAPQPVGAYTLRIDRPQVKDRVGNAMGAGVLDTHFTIKQFSVEWISPTGGNWNTAANWSTGVVPIATDDVFIGVTSSPVVISSGTVTLQSLISKILAPRL